MEYQIYEAFIKQDAFAYGPCGVYVREVKAGCRRATVYEALTRLSRGRKLADPSPSPTKIQPNRASRE